MDFEGVRLWCKKTWVKCKIYIEQGIAIILSSEGKTGKIARLPIELATSHFKLRFGIKTVLIYQQYFFTIKNFADNLHNNLIF
jgi:hypothetical protein